MAVLNAKRDTIRSVSFNVHSMPPCRDFTRRLATCSHQLSFSLWTISAHFIAQCDEIYPICSNCKRLESSCSLSTPNSPTDSEIVEKQLNIEDLQLLNDWHMGKKDRFSDHVAEDSFREQRGREIELGFKHPYGRSNIDFLPHCVPRLTGSPVLHIILAISALHMTSCHPQEPKWYPLAISHHSAAIRLARPHIAAPVSAHHEAIFNFSAFNSLFAFAEPVLRPENEGGTPARHDYVGDLLDSFRMARGIRAVIAKDPSILAEKGLTKNPAWSYDVTHIEATLTNRYLQLPKMELLVTENVEDAAQRAATLKALHRLFVNKAVLDESPKDHSSASLIQRWAIESDNEFLTLCDSRHPVALIVLAHYAVLVQMRSNLWFFQRWPRLILREIGAELRDSRWALWIDEPVREVQRLETESEAEVSS